MSPLRPRPGFRGTSYTATDPEATYQPIRSSLSRYYASRTDGTRTRQAKAASRARRVARSAKTRA